MIYIGGKKFKQTKKFGLSLGGGGARGLAHVGILKVLEKENIKVDCITGTSMGAILGVAYALGFSVEEIEKRIGKFAKNKIFTLRNLNILGGSVLSSKMIDKALTRLVGNKKFKDCKIPVTITAVDIESGEIVHLRKGLLKDALMATSALPSVFPSVLINGRVLVDGGILENVPLLPLKEYKPDITMGVSIANFGVRQNFSGLIFRKYYKNKFKRFLRPFGLLRRFKDSLRLLADTFLRSLAIASKDSDIMREKEAHPDIILRPDVEFGFFDFEKAEDIIKIGEQTMSKALPKLKKLLTS